MCLPFLYETIHTYIIVKQRHSWNRGLIIDFAHLLLVTVQSFAEVEESSWAAFCFAQMHYP